jgi:hypothetical protein
MLFLKESGQPEKIEPPDGIGAKLAIRKAHVCRNPRRVA